MTITPLILGKGRAGLAIAKAFATLNLLSDFEIAPAVWLERGASLEKEKKKYSNVVLCIANPHGLHSQAIIDGDLARFDAILCEKPACVNLNEIQKLREVKTPTAILHGYRQTWGIQTIKNMIGKKLMGEILAIEGRYWQSSAAEKSLLKVGSKTWKDDTSLSGEYDTFLDIATHWVDSVSFLYGLKPRQIKGWKTYSNAESPHRDTHVQLALDFPQGGRALGSISKTYHGATNQFEVNVIGSKMSASWEFLRPDEILVGEGRDRKILTRKDSDFGSKQTPYHAMGWLEGYIEIASQLLTEAFKKEKANYPRLSETLDFLEPMFKTTWN